MTTYRYNYKTDGKDPLNKIKATLELALRGTILTAGFETIVSRPATNFTTAFVRGGTHLFAWTSVTTTYATAILVLTHFRKKDDPWNYLFASHITAGVLYSLTKNAPVAFGFGFTCGIAGAALKKAFMLGWDPINMSSVNTDIYRPGFNMEFSKDVRYSEEK